MKTQSISEKVYIDLTNLYKVKINTGVENVSIDLYRTLSKLYQVQCLRFKDGEYIPFELDFDSSRSHTSHEKSKLSYLNLINELIVYLLPKKIKYFLGFVKFYFPRSRLRNKAEKFQIPINSKVFVPEIQLERSHQKAILSLYSSGIKVVFFVHDLIPTARTGFAPSEISFAFKKYLKISKNAAHVYVPSKQVKNELTKYYLSSKRKTASTAPEISISPPRRRARIESTPECVRLNVQGKKIVYVSSFIKRKNQIMAMRAVSGYSKNTKTTWQLVLVGSNGNMQNILLFLAKKYQSTYFEAIVLESINECCLSSIYQSSTAAMYLSLAEGFGMPIQDAMQEGLPVIASKVPAIDDDNSYSGVSVVDPRYIREIQFAIEEVANGRHPNVFICEPQSTLFWPSLNNI